MVQIFKQLLATLTTVIFSLQASIFGMPASTQLAQVAQVATFTLSPSSTSVNINSTFNVNIVLNTGGQNIYGADINHLHFNPAILQVVDADAAIAGVQIAAGSLMPSTVANLADNVGGSIQFSQLANPGSTYSGSGALAVVTFRAMAAGASDVTFDFTLGSGVDANVAGLGGDLLTSVGNSSYIINNVSGTSVSNTGSQTSTGSTSSGGRSGGSGSSSIVTSSTVGTNTNLSSLSTSQLQTLLASLLKQVAALQAQLSAKSKSGSYTSSVSSSAFTRNLSYRMSGEDVKQLQIFLQSKGYLPSTMVPTTYFGLQTYQALIKYQTVMDITPASGFFGPTTKERVGR